MQQRLAALLMAVLITLTLTIIVWILLTVY
jgi:hypothetical protein